MLALVAALAPGRATAHPLALGVLELREEPGGEVSVAYRFSGTEARARGAEPAMPERCALLGAATESALEGGGVARRARYACGPHGLGGSELAVRGLEGSGVQILVSVARADGTVTRTVLDDGRRTLALARSEARSEARSVLAAYLALGLEHIAGGLDHLLFVLALLLWARHALAVLAAVTAFTAGHSVTLLLAALGLARLPGPPVEACIALSLLVVALELGRPGAQAPRPARAASIAGAFGLLHGLGFAGALRATGLPQGALVPALLGFNVGVELGQLAFVGACLVVGHAAGHLVRDPSRARAPIVLALGGAGTYLLVDRLVHLGTVP